MPDRVEARRCVGGDDPAVAVSNDHGWLVARGQQLADGGDIIGQPRSQGAGRLTRLAAARQRGRLAGDTLLGQQLTGSVPPPRSVLHACPVHKNDPHLDLPVSLQMSTRNGRRTVRYVKNMTTWAG